MTVLILILIALAVAVVVGLILLDHDSILVGVLGVLCLCGAGFGAICYAFTVYSWFAADYKADIVNREYGTNYTREEVFFASGVIDTIRELNRQRIEVNGDVFTGKERAQ